MPDKIKAYQVVAVVNRGDGGVYHIGYWTLDDKCGLWDEMATVNANIKDDPRVVAVVQALQGVVDLERLARTGR